MFYMSFLLCKSFFLESYGEPLLIEAHNNIDKEQNNPEIDIESEPEVMNVDDEERLHNFGDLTTKKDIR